MGLRKTTNVTTHIVQRGSKGQGRAHDASDVRFDNAGTGLGSTTVQAALVELETASGAPGAPGAPGDPGSQIFSGHGAPSDGLGAIGDYYLDRDAPVTLWGPKHRQSIGVVWNNLNETISSGVGAPSSTGVGTYGDRHVYIDVTNYNPATRTGGVPYVRNSPGSEWMGPLNDSTWPAVFTGSDSPVDVEGAEGGDYYVKNPVGGGAILVFQAEWQLSEPTWEGQYVELKGNPGEPGEQGPAGADGADGTVAAAADVPFDNTGSGLTAEDLQAAIDELVTRIEALENPA